MMREGVLANKFLPFDSCTVNGFTSWLTSETKLDYSFLFFFIYHILSIEYLLILLITNFYRKTCSDYLYYFLLTTFFPIYNILKSETLNCFIIMPFFFKKKCFSLSNFHLTDRISSHLMTRYMKVLMFAGDWEYF